MEVSNILKMLNYAGIHFRKDGFSRFKELYGSYIDKSLLEKFVYFAKELAYEYLEKEEVEKITEMIKQGKQSNSFDQVTILQERIRKSIIVLEYFELDRFTFQCSPKDKCNMQLNRLAHITQLLKQDPRYVFGYQSNDEISISSIGTANGSTDKIYYILGILIQLGNHYYLSDGDDKIKINLQNAHNKSFFKNDKVEQVDIGLANLGSVLMMVGEWNDHHGYFQVTNFTIPFFNLKKEIKSQMKNSDLKEILQLDTFGVYNKILKFSSAQEYQTIERQKSLNIFLKDDFDKMWILSNFSFESLLSIQSFENLIKQAIEYKLPPPGAIFFLGQFSSQQIPNHESLYGNELVKIIKHFTDYLQKTLLFFIPSYNDFPLAYSMPKTPINLTLYMKEPTQMMHSLSNPCRLSIKGFNIVITRNDISKEIRKNHIQSFQAGHEHLCETIISQQYLGTFQSNQICYKWNYDFAMLLDPSVDLVVLCDLTADQFKYQTIINDTQVMNPGNFQKLDFGIIGFNNKKQTMSCQTANLNQK
ncbi:unnamed protein product (macronuclear) [Paramecium tetraurelia]|uniref:DNA polymerase II subunit 2 n=1 Tax=Paramecium tetraurelia TaxID=5888 RepID=A0CT57_PARTE|nr:uncharacterized protein GSPATT00010208001 [Paramecium tetraurelia]CAK73974.1 unnamed protein product [Paramecium tetraurelia]|eukprot:XP_001441371.1 hypothetical protein (macronuclear) [Paramecium tetraurelia strain d4-2]